MMKPIVHGNAQSYSTNLCQMTLHQLPQGAALPKASHHLARWILVVRGTVQMITGTNSEKKLLAEKQSILLHSYTNCLIENLNSEEAWIFEFAFMTLDPIAAPAVRSMNAIKSNEQVQVKSQFQLPDWNVEWVELLPGQVLLTPSSMETGYYFSVDKNTDAQVEFTKASQVQVVDGGKDGKHVFLIQENMELWKE